MPTRCWWFMGICGPPPPTALCVLGAHFSLAQSWHSCSPFLLRKLRSVSPAYVWAPVAFASAPDNSGLWRKEHKLWTSPSQSPRQNGSCLLEDGRWLISPNLLSSWSLCKSPGKKMLFNCPVFALHWRCTYFRQRTSRRGSRHSLKVSGIYQSGQNRCASQGASPLHFSSL